MTIGNLTFSMSLSCLFSDSKLAYQLGGLLIFLPILIFFGILNGEISNECVK